MNLGELISQLEQMDPGLRVENGFGSPHSDRGDYSELAFTPLPAARVGDMLQHAKNALGQRFEGYKGGSYLMNALTPVLIGHYGECGESITAAHIRDWRSFGQETCVWGRESEDINWWGASCGYEFLINDDGPGENGMRYCPSCGKRIREQPNE